MGRKFAFIGVYSRLKNSLGEDLGCNVSLALIRATWHYAFMDIGQFIVKTPGNCGGRARLSGKRIPVSSIYRWFLQGAAPEDILAKFDGVSLSEIYAAISYALANSTEIMSEIESEDQLVSQATSPVAVHAVECK